MKRFRFFSFESAVLVPKPSNEMLIQQLVSEAISVAGQSTGEHGAKIKFSYERVDVTIRGDSNLNLIVRDWWRAVYEQIIPVIGPWPDHQLSTQEQANDELIHRAMVKLIEAPRVSTYMGPMGWESISRNPALIPIQRATFSYAERWARMMQFMMPNRAPSWQICESAAREVGIPTLIKRERVEIFNGAWEILKGSWFYANKQEMNPDSRLIMAHKVV